MKRRIDIIDMLIIVSTVAIIAMISVVFFGIKNRADAQQTNQTCPAGSYDIGISDKTGAPICKLEPTGCPYGDSIPLGPDCDKHAPQPIETVTPAQPIEDVQFEGK